MPKKKVTILLTCIGRRVSLLRAFRSAFSRLGLAGTIIGTDTTEYSAALQCCDRKYIVRPVSRRGYAGEIINIIKKEGVELLIPTVDLDLSIWSRRRRELAKIGCSVLVSSPDVVRLCQDKRLMFRFLKKNGFDTPQTLSVAKVLKSKRGDFPYFLKPWDGHAGKGNAKIADRQELLFYSRRISNCMVQEFIEGQEYTVDVLVDFDGRVRCVVPRLRMEVRTGEVSKAQTVRCPEVIEQSKRLVETLGAGPGIITIQCFLTTDGNIKFIEINPRFGGGVPLSIRAGADFPRWILQLWLGDSPRIRQDVWQDGLVMLRYDDAIWMSASKGGK